MVDLYNSNITDILPEALSADPRVQALGYALNKGIQRLIGYCQNIGIYNSIDTLPEQVIDLLALELNTQYYDDTMDVEIKRSLVKNTLNWYMYTGTKAAVQELVRSVFGDGEIEEWFEYGGEPYHFKIHTFNVEATDEMLKLAETLVRSIQNARSHLEEVIVEIKESMTLYIGLGVSVEDDIALRCETAPVGIYLTDETGLQLTNEDGDELYRL